MSPTQTDHYQVQGLLGKLNRLCAIDPSGIERISRAVDLELENLKATAKSLSAAERDLCGHTGVNPETLAQFQARRAADEKIVAGIPKDKLVIMKCMYGDDVATLANRERELQKQIRDGKVAR
jgi:hypothetical protein